MEPFGRECTCVPLIAISSDHHEGDGSLRDDFTATLESRFLQELQMIREWTEHFNTMVVLNGDVVDAWRYKLKDIIRAHQEVFRALSELGVVWVNGNHDENVSRADFESLGIGDGIIFVSKVIIYNYLVLHGDIFDPRPALWKKVGKAACHLLARVGSHISPSLEDRLSSLGSRLEGVGSRSKDPDRYGVEAIRMARENGLKGAILGHTHRPVESEEYVNTGKWDRDGWTVLWSDGVITRWKLT